MKYELSNALSLCNWLSNINIIEDLENPDNPETLMHDLIILRMNDCTEKEDLESLITLILEGLGYEILESSPDPCFDIEHVRIKPYEIFSKDFTKDGFYFRVEASLVSAEERLVLIHIIQLIDS